MRKLAHLVVVCAGLAGCATGSSQDDERFAQVQERGRTVMGVDQYTSTHVFESLPDGGRIELQRDSADGTDVAQIRRHIREIQTAFAKGDFTMPGLVHAMKVPGTDVMAAARGALRYEYRELPRGAELRIFASTEATIKAVHEFLAFQRMDHRAHGHH